MPLVLMGERFKMVSLFRQNMKPVITYQQDTVVVESLSNSLPVSDSLNIGRKAGSPRESSEQAMPNTEKPVPRKYTPQQIRYWRARQEDKLLIDSSKYIRSRVEPGVEYTEQPAQQIVLPMREKMASDTDWITALLFTALVLFASIRYSYVKYIKHLFTSLLSYTTSVRLFQESSYPPSHVTFRLDVVFYLTSSIFIYQALSEFTSPDIHNKFVFFTIVLLGVLLYYLTKKFIYHILGLMFETREETGEYLFNLNNSNRSLGLALLPLVALVALSPFQTPMFLIITGIIIFSIFQVMLLRRGILILLRKQFSIFYLFLYLCTLEFLPLLLIYKIVVVE